MPAIDVRLHGRDGGQYPLRMLPDSGADCSCFPEAFAPVLGVDLSECVSERVHTGAGTTEHYRSEDRLRATIADQEVELVASFGHIGVPVLGREDFFSHFEVLIDERRQRVVIKPYRQPARSG